VASGHYHWLPLARPARAPAAMASAAAALMASSEPGPLEDADGNDIEDLDGNRAVLTPTAPCRSTTPRTSREPKP
jgi:hypothetical protein